MIGAYMVDPVVIWKWNGYDSWNEPLSGTAVDAVGYVEWGTKLVRNLKGELVPSTARILLSKIVDYQLGRPLCHEDRIEISGAGTPRVILAIEKPKELGFSGLFYEVSLA